MDKGNIIFLFFTIYLSCHLFGFPFSFFSPRIFLHFFLFSSLSFILFSLLSSVNSSLFIFSIPSFCFSFLHHIISCGYIHLLYHVYFSAVIPVHISWFSDILSSILFLTTFKFYKSIHKFQQMWQLPLCKQEPLHLTD